MLEQLLIFTRGGLILWAFTEFGQALKGSPIDTFIRSCLLEERSGTASYNYDAPGTSYTIKWTFHNEFGLVFVAVYYHILQLTYVDDLLSKVKQEFVKTYDPKRTSYIGFDDIFQQLKKEVEARAEEVKISKQVGKSLSNNLGRNQRLTQNGLADGGNEKNSGDHDGGDSISLKCHPLENEKNKNHRLGKGEIPSKVNAPRKENETSDTAAFDREKIKKLWSKGGKKTDSGVRMISKVEPKQKITKMNGVQDDSLLEARLDFTESMSGDGQQNLSVVAADDGESMMDREEIFNSEREDAKVDPEKEGWFSSMIKSISGKANLEKSDLEPALKALRDMLIIKNVPQEIAEKVGESVAASLEGKKQASFTTISSTVQIAKEDALVRILTPKRSINILREVHASQEKGRPYVVVFAGVNGVGKSTNLAKVAYWLSQHKIKVVMAACDTFRSGAIEQLRVHACRLQIPLFEKGYGKDSAVVAKQVIQEAKRNGCDVVLIDTAGRMQDNKDLMQALAKLIHINSPDLVLFVGEALVGSSSVNQLLMFNQNLGEFSLSPNPRLIDGILLTKFDTIDEKVGAAVSMAYVSGSPIMFVGCGQSYANLKKLNIKEVVKSLLT